MPTPAASAISPRMSGLMPPTSAATGSGGGGAGGGGAGTASTTGKTQPVGPCAAVAAAAPHIAAAGAPPLMALSTAQGSTCGGALGDAIAVVELITREPATNTPITCFNPWLAISSLRHNGCVPHRH